jgi:hypothetical protein
MSLHWLAGYELRRGWRGPSPNIVVVVVSQSTRYATSAGNAGCDKPAHACGWRVPHAHATENTHPPAPRPPRPRPPPRPADITATSTPELPAFHRLPSNAQHSISLLHASLCCRTALNHKGNHQQLLLLLQVLSCWRSAVFCTWQGQLLKAQAGCDDLASITGRQGAIKQQTTAR